MIKPGEILLLPSLPVAATRITPGSTVIPLSAMIPIFHSMNN
ncbi:MAG: hypothetical protein DSY57_04590 [Desulfobulbus sp.]|nr:MAG: hypothetical protein DSY57_04590 [Desulfobulbus sp.]